MRLEYEILSILLDGSSVPVPDLLNLFKGRISKTRDTLGFLAAQRFVRLSPSGGSVRITSAGKVRLMQLEESFSVQAKANRQALFTLIVSAIAAAASAVGVVVSVFAFLG